MRFFLIFMMVFSFVTRANAETREIVVKTEKVGEVVHWMPEKIEVKPGEKIHFKIEHSLKGGFDFHGFTIDTLKIVQTVNRNSPTEVDIAIPKDMKPGEYNITCQYHPKHAAAKLIVKN